MAPKNPKDWTAEELNDYNTPFPLPGHSCAYRDTPLGRKIGCDGRWMICRGYFRAPNGDRTDLYACEAHARWRMSLNLGPGVSFVPVRRKR